MPDKPPINLDDFDFGNTIRGHQKGDRVFERFQLRRLLGRGGMGVVWLAMDERLGREVALKFAPESIRYDEILVEELKEETRKGLGLAHPNIVKIYDFLFDEENAAISMEFIDGENLGSLRTQQPNKVFEVSHITHWIAQVLDALDYAHRVARVIHRDLKPANLMIDRDGSLRVTDFGIARTISDAISRATLGGEPSTGTLAYMSPQQASGRKPAVSDDIYAIGSTIYELLTGKPPFYTGNISQQLSNDLVTPPSARRSEFGITTAMPIPPEWEQTVMACLEKDPAARPQTAVQIRDRLGLTSLSPASVSVSATATTFLPGVVDSGGAMPTPTTQPPISRLTSAHEVRRDTVPATQPAAQLPPIDAGKFRVGGVPPVPPAPSPAVPAPEPASAKANMGTVLGIGVIAVLLLFLGVGGWVAYKFVLPLFVHTPPPKVEPGKKEPKGPDTPPTKKEPEVVVKHDPKDKPPTTPEVKTDKKDDPKMSTTPDAPKFTTIQAAINKAKAGETVTVPEGTYEEQLKFKDGIQLKAAASGKVIVQTDGRTGSVLMVEGCKAGTVSGIVFQHPGEDVLENVNWPVVLVKSSSIVFTDCTVQGGVGDGMWLTGVGKSQVKNCVFRRNAKNGLLIESGSAPTVDGCEARKNGASGIEVQFTGTSPLLTNNVCIDNGGSGLSIKDGASASVSQKNKMQINAEAGIAVLGEGTSATIQSAHCEGNFLGLTVQKGAKADISGCTILDSKGVGIHLDMAADGCEITGNTVEKSTHYGCMVTGAPSTAAKVIGNKARFNGADGIGVFGEGFKPQVEKNECEKNSHHGIFASEGVSGVIRGNITRGNSLGGILQAKAAADLVIDANQTEEVNK